MYKIKTLNKISPLGLDRFDKNYYSCSDDVENPDGILVRSASMHDMQMPDTLKAIARAGAGVNNIPLDVCTEKGIVVFNTPGANANAVKELVLCGLFLASRKITGGIDWAKTLGDEEDVAKAVEKGKGAFAGPEITGKTLGVIGLGAIGVLVANAAEKLGMKVYGYDPYLSVDAAWNLSHNVIHAKDLAEIYKNCDYITVHVPCNKETKEMICGESIATMKEGVRILNFARGELAASDDVIAALSSGKIACYVTDFPNEKLIGVEGVIAIPHLGASTPESENNCAFMAANEMIGYLENGSIKNSVNMPNTELARPEGERVCVIHKNAPNLIAQITSCFSGVGINIEKLVNNSKGDIAYTVTDVNDEIPDSVITALKAIDGVVRVRKIK